MARRASCVCGVRNVLEREHNVWRRRSCDMAEKTKIAWTDHTANFWMGCHKVSDGCTNCYAELLTRDRMGLHVWGPPATTPRQPAKGIWKSVQRWNREAARGVPGVLGPGQPHLVFTG